MFCFNYPASSGQIPYLNCMRLIFLFKYMGIQQNMSLNLVLKWAEIITKTKLVCDF